MPAPSNGPTSDVKQVVNTKPTCIIQRAACAPSPLHHFFTFGGYFRFCGAHFAAVGPSPVSDAHWEKTL